MNNPAQVKIFGISNYKFIKEEVFQLNINENLVTLQNQLQIYAKQILNDYDKKKLVFCLNLVNCLSFINKEIFQKRGN